MINDPTQWQNYGLVVWLDDTTVPYEHALSTFGVEGRVVIGTEVGKELLQLGLQANWFTNSHGSSCPFLIFT